MHPISLIPSSIGRIALSILAQTQEARVWGTTSRGLFLHLPPGWIVFLSAEPFRGPLTLNLCGRERPFEFPPARRAVSPGMQAKLNSESLLFEELAVIIRLDAEAKWSPPPLPDAPAEQFERRFQRLEQLSVISHQLPSTSFPLSATSYQLSATIYHLINNLGLGEGLTPAGDDVALGFLLAANRWRELLCPNLDLQPTNRAIQQAANAKTSTLSANLIDCAIQGQADERLILALDGIITGQPTLEECLSYLTGWGSSSGAWALQGMALAIKTFNQQVNP